MLHDVLTIALSFPAVMFTVMMALSLVYWLFVVLGAVDVDALGGSADGTLEGATKGVFEGATKGALDGALDGATKGALEGVVKGGLEVGAEGVEGALEGSDGLLATLISALRLRSAPVTVVLSLFAVFGWLACMTFAQQFGQPGWLLGAGVAAGASVLALLVTSVVIRPLAPVFAMREAKGNVDSIGKIAVISTGEVTRTFGQATLEDGGAGLILQVRDETGTLRRGDRVVIVHFEESQRAFHVEKMPSADEVLLAGAGPLRVADPGAPDEPGPDEPADAARAGEQRTD